MNPNNGTDKCRCKIRYASSTHVETPAVSSRYQFIRSVRGWVGRFPAMRQWPLCVRKESNQVRTCSMSTPHDDSPRIVGTYVRPCRRLATCHYANGYDVISFEFFSSRFRRFAFVSEQQNNRRAVLCQMTTRSTPPQSLFALTVECRVRCSVFCYSCFMFP